jgi:AbrB family looped-hinge helix DNA binding protein
MQATVSDKGQVTIPVALREQLGIKPGTRLAFAVDADGRLRLSLLAQGSAGLAGLLAKPGERVRSLQDMDAAVSGQVRARSRRRP